MRLKVILKISYQEQEGGVAKIWEPEVRPVIDYETVHAGNLGIVDEEPSGFEFDIPDDDVCQIKTGAWQNKTGDEITWVLNGDTVYSQQADDLVVLTNNSNDSEEPIWNIAAFTVNNQVGAGGLRYFVAGDVW